MTKSRKIIIIVLSVIVFLILFFPHRFTYKDGGTKGYEALTYRLSDYHALPNEENKALRGKTVEILGFKVYDGTYYIDIPIQE